MRIRFSLQNRLVLSSTLTLLVLMIIMALFLSQLMIEQLKDNTNDMLQTVDSAIGKNVRSTVMAYRQAVESIATASAVRNAGSVLSGAVRGGEEQIKKHLEQYMQGLRQRYPMFSQVRIMRDDGTLFASSSTAGNGSVVQGREFFREALSGHTVLSEPEQASSGQKIITLATPLRDDKMAVVGVVCCTIPTTEFTQATIGSIKIGKTGYCYLVHGKSGLMMAHAKDEKVAALDMFKSQPWMRDLTPGRVTVQAMLSSEGIQRLIACLYEPETDTISVACLEETELEGQVAYIRYTTFALVIGVSLIVGGVLIYLVRSMVEDLKKTNAFAQEVAAGNLDETLFITRSDEIGELGHALQQMVISLKEKIHSSKIEAEKTRIALQDAEKAQAEATAQASDALKTHEQILSVAGRIETMFNAVTEANEKMAQQIEESHQGAADSAARLRDATSAMADMNAAVQDVASNASTASASSEDTNTQALAGTSVVSRCVTSIDATREAALALQQDMLELNEHAQSISQIMKVISDIADQTNLLALNAAIEAARAGDAGRGFAVVADEVRKLAEKTMASTKDVADVITSIQESSDKSMHAMERATTRIEEATTYAKQSGEALDAIVQKVVVTSQQVQAIATAAEQQTATSESINGTILELNNLASQTTAAMEGARLEISHVTTQMATMKDLIRELRA